MSAHSLKTSLAAAVRAAPFWKRRSAHRLASGAKRLDVCAAQIAHLFHLGGLGSLEGKTAVELGCGAVMSHAVVFHVLGADRVYATDLVRMADPRALKHAVRSATASIVRDILSPFADHERLRARVDRLMAWKDFTSEGLEPLGLHYIAPVDLARNALPFPCDFVYSNSVLEHVPPEDIGSVLSNVGAAVADGGVMLHAIHLEDHRDHVRRPFDFLSLPASGYPRAACYSRGNRVRASVWNKHFSSLIRFDTTSLYQWRRPADLLPARIDGSVSNAGLDDLRTSHLGLMARRRKEL